MNKKLLIVFIFMALAFSIYFAASTYIWMLSTSGGGKNTYSIILLKIVDVGLRHSVEADENECSQKTDAKLRQCAGAWSSNKYHMCPNWLMQPNCAMVTVGREYLTSSMINILNEFSEKPCEFIKRLDISERQMQEHMKQIGCFDALSRKIYWVVNVRDSDNFFVFVTSVN